MVTIYTCFIPFHVDPLFSVMTRPTQNPSLSLPYAATFRLEIVDWDCPVSVSQPSFAFSVWIFFCK